MAYTFVKGVFCLSKSFFSSKVQGLRLPIVIQTSSVDIWDRTICGTRQFLSELLLAIYVGLLVKSMCREGDTYVINGTKWWTSGAMDPRCKVLIVMGKTDFTAAKHKQQSMIIVDTHTPGVHIKRPLMVFGFDDAPHGHAEVSFVNVHVPAKNIILGEGRGFEIAQGRLGPGRLHHCMRLIGAAERGMQMMAQRAPSKRVFGKLIAEQGSFISDIAKLEKARLLVLQAADQLDKLGNKKARGIIAMGKVTAPSMALKVLDMVMQVLENKQVLIQQYKP